MISQRPPKVSRKFLPTEGAVVALSLVVPDALSRPRFQCGIVQQILQRFGGLYGGEDEWLGLVE